MNNPKNKLNKEKKSYWDKLFNWEFWPFHLFYFPVYLYWIYLAIKARSFFFFSASNPSISYGGFLGESKIDLYHIIPKEYQPQTRQFSHTLSKNKIIEEVEQTFTYPFIVKPDVGERGLNVEKIQTKTELSDYLHQNAFDILVQDFIDYPIELGVFFVKLPHQQSGKITSIVEKSFLSVVGNGKATILELMNNESRARLHIARLSSKIDMNKILKKGEKMLLEPIGNHSRGTVFKNGWNHYSKQLDEAFNAIASKIEGFYFGRFDLKCESITSLENLKHFSILELNGAGAEPAHIYHPNTSIIQAYTAIFEHLNYLCTISKYNHKHKGVKYMTLSEAIELYKAVRKYRKARV